MNEGGTDMVVIKHFCCVWGYVET